MEMPAKADNQEHQNALISLKEKRSSPIFVGRGKGFVSKPNAKNA